MAAAKFGQAEGRRDQQEREHQDTTLRKPVPVKCASMQACLTEPCRLILSDVNEAARLGLARLHARALNRQRFSVMWCPMFALLLVAASLGLSNFAAAISDGRGLVAPGPGCASE